MHARPWRHRLTIAAALTALLLGSGCSFFSPDDSGSDEPSDSASAQSSDEPSDDASEDGGKKDSGDDDVLATRDFTADEGGDSIPIRLDVLALERRDDLLQLRVRLTNTMSDPDNEWQISETFNGEEREDLDTQSGAFAGVVLTDDKENKRYLVAADSEKSCVCSTELTAVFLDAEQHVDLVATFAAPPASTESMDLQIPLVGQVNDVPIS